ncbi:DUF2993 domain-containing protein [Phormidium sp. CLA17]|uniref:LmeA family phospholipid-binding protein n=1 Tax=Leptolyngbya sp. Cla-17 TaxID=2803751 RepID=UPI001491E1EA|nr:DUF2993 domain-containing protein [Leptolyngbya sp. Cla-17]MBM0740950.1 DUF2993 domain-containing protein [Leptolyngbya sp. Cla-17]
MVSNSPDLGEQALSKVAEIGIANQLDEVEDFNVDIRTNPGKLLQGEVDSVAISGKGMVIKQDLRMESLEIQTNQVSINPFSAFFGNIELSQPADADAQIVLTEGDLNRALESDYIANKLQDLKLQVDGQSHTIKVHRADVRLLEQGTLSLNVDFLVRENNEAKSLSATVIPQIKENGQQVNLEILSVAGQGLTPELGLAILKQLTMLLDLSNFDMPGMALWLQKIDIQAQRLIIHAKTKIEQIPTF